MPRGRPRQETPSPENPAATTQTDGDILSRAADIADAFVVIVVSPYGNPRRRVYLSLSHATQAVQRAHKRGLPAGMVLCRLVPLPADLGEE
jgi:hypothetical protein